MGSFEVQRDASVPARRHGSNTSELVQRVSLAAIVVLFGMATPSIGHAQTVDTRLPTVEPGGRVLAIERMGDILYLGGNFRTMGPSTGSGVHVDPVDGSPQKGSPVVTGQVSAVVADGSGGWYLGGAFVAVNGAPRSNLAHLRADGSLNEAFPQADGAARALALAHNRLYVGGEFTTMSGAPRGRLAAIDIITGALESWSPDADAWVLALAVNGNAVFAGGMFNRIGGTERRGLAALDATNGLATTWTAHVDSFRSVYALAIHEDALCAGGNFRTIGGQPRRGLALLDLCSAAVLEPRFDVERIPDWYHYDLGPAVEVLASHGKRLYVGGSFTHIGGEARNGAAAIEADGMVTKWDAQLETTPGTPAARCLAIAAHGQTIYLGGDFVGIASGGRGHAGAVDARTGALLAWDARPNGRVLAFAATAGATFMGGDFTSTWSWQTRNALAAVNARTGELLPWNPDANQLVSSLVAADGSIYVAGGFSRVAGAERAGLAELDPITGAATAWNPQPNNWVRALAPAGETVIVGGGFSRIGGQLRRNLAAIDRTTGLATAWDPSPNDDIEALIVKDGTLYAGGWFWTVGGAPREAMAAFDLATGALTEWNPGVYGTVLALAANEDAVYAGGGFSRVGGVPRQRLAAIDRATGQVLAWSPEPVGGVPSNRIQALALQGQTLYVGGIFTEIGGAQRNCLAALDVRSGTALDWGLTPESTVWCMTSYPDAIYVGGGFHHIGEAPAAGLPSLAPLGVIAQKPRSVARLESTGTTIAAVAAHHPPSGDARLRFRLLAPGRVSLAIFDVQGRRVANPLEAAPHGAGDHEVGLETERWPEGCYVFRLTSGNEVANGRFVVIH